jgi:hypothetical protein
MTPAAELRAAAATLRKRGAEATPGPWDRPLNTRYKHIVTAPKPDGEQGRHLDGRPERVGVVQLNIWWNGSFMRKRGGRDLEWIALANPALAEPLAALLDNAAELYEFGINGCSEDLRDRLEPNVRATVEHELAVARLINRPRDEVTRA